MFIIPAVVGFGLANNAPEVIAPPMGLETQREILAQQETWTNIPVNERPYASAFIMSNNIRIAILAFGGGVLLGLFSFYIMSFNGLHIGSVLGLAHHYGQGDELMNFIIGHGIIELSVIFMSGGAGLYLGWSLLNPGIHSRKDSLASAARTSVPIIISSIILLVMAGLIEGFISPTSLSFFEKASVGITSGIFMYGYLLLMGHETAIHEAKRPIWTNRYYQ
jgi:uncharacterized membrane protein SpoIIM required for sporulation